MPFNFLCRKTQELKVRYRSPSNMVHTLIRLLWEAGLCTSLLDYYLLSLPRTVFPINLLYSAKSVGEQSISLTSKLGGCKSKRKRSSATQRFVYIFGSSIVTVSSR